MSNETDKQGKPVIFEIIDLESNKIILTGIETTNKKLMTGGRVVLRQEPKDKSLPIGTASKIAALTGKTTVINS